MVDVAATSVIGQAQKNLQEQQQALEAQAAQIAQAQQQKAQQEAQVQAQIKQARSLGTSYAQRQAIAKQTGSGLAGMRALQQQTLAVSKYEARAGQELKRYGESITGAEATYQQNVQALKEYRQQVDSAAEYEQAYKSVMRAYEKGNLGLIAMSGLGLKSQIAKQLLKEGYAGGTGIAESYAAERKAAIKEALGFGADVKSGTLFYEGKPLRLQDVQNLKTLQGTTTAPVPIVETPFLSVTAAPTFSERYKQSVGQSGYIKGTLGFPGSELSRGYARLMENIYKKNPSYASLYMSDKPTQTLIQAAPSIAAYSSPAGPALIFLGGVESIYKSPTWQGKALGLVEAGVGAFGVRTQLKNIKLASDIKNAKTIFYAEETALGPGASSIKTISKTKIGKESYFGFTKSGVIDYPSPIGDVRIGQSRGLVIAGNKRVYPIDVITSRVQPTKEIFISEVAGEAARVKELGEGYKIGVGQGEGVLSVSRIKNLEGGYSKAATAGGFKPSETEGFFSFVGGDKPMINKLATSVRAKINIQGIVKQVKSESSLFFKESSGVMQLQKGKQVLGSASEQMIAGAVATQRATALDIARQGIKSLAPVKTIGVMTALGTQETKQEAKTLITTQKLRTKEETALKTKVTTTQIPRVTQVQVPKVSQIEQLRLKEITDLRTNVLQSLRLNQQQQTRQQTTQQTKSQTPLRTKYIIPPIVDDEYKRNKFKDLLEKISKKKVFGVFARRKGKDMLIGKAETEIGAGKTLRQYLKASLAASGYVEESGKKIAPEVLGLDYEFGKSKRDAYRVVQKRGFRLGTRSEVSEIVGFKRRKKRNKNLKWV